MLIINLINQPKKFVAKWTLYCYIVFLYLYIYLGNRAVILSFCKTIYLRNLEVFQTCFLMSSMQISAIFFINGLVNVGGDPTFKIIPKLLYVYSIVCCFSCLVRSIWARDWHYIYSIVCCCFSKYTIKYRFNQKLR